MHMKAKSAKKWNTTNKIFFWMDVVAFIIFENYSKISPPKWRFWGVKIYKLNLFWGFVLARYIYIYIYSNRPLHDNGWGKKSEFHVYLKIIIVYNRKIATIWTWTLKRNIERFLFELFFSSTRGLLYSGKSLWLQRMFTLWATNDKMCTE